MSIDALASNIKVFTQSKDSREILDPPFYFSLLKSQLRDQLNYKWSISKASWFIRASDIEAEDLILYIHQITSLLSNQSPKGLKGLKTFETTLRNSKEFIRTTNGARIELKPTTDKISLVKLLKRHWEEQREFINCSAADYILFIHQNYQTGLNISTLNKYWYSRDYEQ
ncbi:hypothetical protein [Leeuwenhoekiella palythoae]|uniref:hypothetical protein n=1 Tax=Leeuwenhoekiella palythoae TaxID=573501 RepID=UPI003512E35D